MGAEPAFPAGRVGDRRTGGTGVADGFEVGGAAEMGEPVAEGHQAGPGAFQHRDASGPEPGRGIQVDGRREVGQDRHWLAGGAGRSQDGGLVGAVAVELGHQVERERHHGHRFLGVSNLMEVDVVERGPGAACRMKLGDSALVAERGEVDGTGSAHAVIRPEPVRLEPHGSDGPNRVPGMVERLVFLGAATQVMLRLGPGVPLQASIQNDGERPDLAQGTPVHVYLAPDALRVLGGAKREVPVASEDEPLVAS
jgi:TOBE domain